MNLSVILRLYVLLVLRLSQELLHHTNGATVAKHLDEEGEGEGEYEGEDESEDEAGAGAEEEAEASSLKHTLVIAHRHRRLASAKCSFSIS